MCFFKDIMGIKKLMLHDDLASLSDGKEQSKAKFKTTFCGICSLSNELLPIIKEISFGKMFYSSVKDFFVLLETRIFLRLYESMRRDTDMYIPDILCV
jgi:hypothetical protein